MLSIQILACIQRVKTYPPKGAVEVRVRIGTQFLRIGHVARQYTAAAKAVLDSGPDKYCAYFKFRDLQTSTALGRCPSPFFDRLS